MRRTFPVLVIAAAAAGGFPAFGTAQVSLAGTTYAFTGVRSCIVSLKPFKTDTSGAPTIIADEVSYLAAVDSGKFVFNTDGVSGAQTGRGDELDLSERRVGASVSHLIEFSVPFTYVVNRDGTLVVNLGQGTFAVLLGGGAGQTGTTSPRTDRFQLVENSDAFLSAPKTAIAQEAVQFNVPKGGPFSEYRLCTRSGTRGLVTARH